MNCISKNTTLLWMQQQLAALFARIHWDADEFRTLAVPHRHGKLRTFLWIAGIFSFSAVYFLTYFPPLHLHDPAHFATAGINVVRDHKDLLYPYHPYAPDGLGPAYEFFQKGCIHFDARTSYPSKLYSLIYGAICAANGGMKLEYMQWMSFAGFFLGNILLYLIGVRLVQGVELACLFLSVTFLPVMRVTIYPGTDSYGYASSLALLWMCLCLRVNPFALGIMAGILAHFRGQMLSTLLIFPFLYAFGTRKHYFRHGLMPMAAGFAITYISMAFIFKTLIDSTAAANPVDFYIHHFSKAMYGRSELDLAIGKFSAAIIDTFDKSQLFLFGGLALLCTVRRNAPLQQSLAVCSLVYIVLPILLFSTERFTPPQPRYYIFAVPMIALAATLYFKTLPYSIAATSAKWCMILLTVINVLAWKTVCGFPFEKLNPASIASRAHFLDFAGVEEALAETFLDDDVVVINHSLPTGLSRLHNVIYVPKYSAFLNGDNRRIRGLVFVYGHNSPNNFFEPRDWLKEGAMPLTIRDSRGITFAQAYAQTSKIVEADGTTADEAFFVIYKNTGKL